MKKLLLGIVLFVGLNSFAAVANDQECFNAPELAISAELDHLDQSDDVVRCRWISGYFRKNGTWVSGHWKGC